MAMNKPYFDTNILLNISLIKQVEKFYSSFPLIKICERVSKEIEKWNIAEYNFAFVYFDMFHKIQSKHIEIVPLSNYTKDEQRIIEYQTRTIKRDLDTIGNEKDLGEIHSVFMAQIDHSPYFCTEDNKFVRNYKERHFPDLEVKNYDYILNELFDTEEEIEYNRKLTNIERKNMDNEYDRIKQQGEVKENDTYSEEQLILFSQIIQQFNEK